MLTREFEGKNEQEAIRTACRELHIPEEKMDIELLEKSKGRLFGLGGGKNARIRVTYRQKDQEQARIAAEVEVPSDAAVEKYQDAAVEFLQGLFERMGIGVTIHDPHFSDGKLFFELSSDSSALVIGKRGKTLEAIQMIANIVASKQSGKIIKSVIDIENYREKREIVLRDLAHKVAEEVRRTHRVRSLEPMNPFERRLIHVALQDEKDVETRSEGEGVYRKVKILPKR